MPNRETDLDTRAIIENMEFMHSNDETFLRACARLDLKPDTCETILRRARRSDLKAKMKQRQVRLEGSR